MGFLRFLLSPMRGVVWLYTVLFLFFFAVGVVGMLFGDLGGIDNWLSANGDLIETIGLILFRLFWGFVLLMCAAVFVALALGTVDWFRRRGADARPAPGAPDQFGCAGLGCTALGTALVAYFAWFGVFY